MVGVEREGCEVQAVLPVGTGELTLAVHNLSAHGSATAIGVARVEDDTGVVHLVLAFTLLDSHECHLILAVKAPSIDEIAIGAARAVDIRLVAIFSIDAYIHLGKMTH